MQQNTKKSAIISIILPIVIPTILTAACQKAEWFGTVIPYSAIRVVVSSSDTKTKSSTESAEVVRTIRFADNDSLFLTETVTDNLECPLLFENATKGTIMTTELINSDGKSFAIDAYLAAAIASATDAEEEDKTDFHFIKSRTLDYTAGEWVWAGGDAPLWRDNIETRFWSYYPASAPGRSLTLPGGGSATPGDEAQKTLSFSYSLPAGGSTSDAQNQSDLMFAFNTHRYNGSAPTVNVHFYHALAAVKFDITNVVDMTVEAIEIRNVCSSGSCSMTAPINAVSFNWTPSASTSSYKQAFSSSADFETVGERETQKVSGKKVFFMIPHTLGSTAALAVTFRKNGNGKVFTHYANITGTTWEPGKYYTYAISCNGEFSFDLMEEDLSDIGPRAMSCDSHYENAMMRFSGVKPSAAQVVITDPYGGATFNPLTAYNTAADWIEFGKPASQSAYSDYPGTTGSTVNINTLLNELGKDGSKAHFLEVEEDGEKVYYTQVYINENFYNGKALNTFVGKAIAPRTFSLSLSTGNITSLAPVVFTQKPIQTPYNLATAANPFGVETIEENNVTAGSSASEWCRSRNRNGANVWRAPSLQEYWNIWYGAHGMTDESWLGLGTSLSRENYLSADSKAYNGLKSVTITSPAGTGTVRCIRDLKGGSAGSSMSSVSTEEGVLSAGEAGTKYILQVSDVSAESMRGKVTGRELSATIAPGSGTDGSDNMLFSKIQIASRYLTWQLPDNQTTVVPRFEYNLAVEKDIAKAGGDFEVSYTNSGGTVTIEGKVKMINPDPRLVYSTSFVKLQGAPDPIPNTERSLLDNEGVLHFHIEYSGWSAQNSGSGWTLKAAVKSSNGTISTLADNICTLYFAITKKNVSGAWGSPYTASPPSITNGTMIGDAPIAVGSQNFRMVVADGGPYTVQNVRVPVISEYFDGSDANNDERYSDHFCEQYYYEDTRAVMTGGTVTESKSDLGQWRAPNQRELNLILQHSASLPIYQSTSTGHYVDETTQQTPEYTWSLNYGWIGDQISAPGIKYGSSQYYNANGIIAVDGSAPYKIRCVRDVE